MSVLWLLPPVGWGLGCECGCGVAGSGPALGSETHWSGATPAAEPLHGDTLALSHLSEPQGPRLCCKRWSPHGGTWGCHQGQVCHGLRTPQMGFRPKCADMDVADSKCLSWPGTSPGGARCPWGGELTSHTLLLAGGPRALEIPVPSLPEGVPCLCQDTSLFSPTATLALGRCFRVLRWAC